MLYKKMVALLVVFVFTLGMMTGCSQVERGFYELVKEVTNANSFEFKGSIEVSIEQLPKSAFNNSPAITEDVFKQMVNNNRIDYQGKADYTQGVLSYEFTLVDKNTGTQTALTTVIIKDDKVYVKMDDLIDYIEKWCNDEDKQKLDKVFGGVEYFSFSSQDLQNEINMPPGSPPLWKDNILRDSKETNRLYMGLYDELVYKGYDKYSGNFITKNGNMYSMSFKFADAGRTFKPIAVYTINNIYQIGTAIKGFFNGLSEDDLARLGISQQTNKQILVGIDQMIDDVNKNRTNYLDEIDSGVSEMNDEIVKVLGDSDIQMTLEKKDAKTYESSSRIRLNLTDASESLKLTFSTQGSTSIVGGVTVASPSSSITYRELKNRIPVKLAVNIDEKTYNREALFENESDQYIDVRIIKGASYLPLRRTADLLNQKVGWDNYLKKGYIEYNGEHRYIEGQLINGITYVKATEFGQFGFSVSWDGATRTIIITKG